MADEQFGSEQHPGQALRQLRNRRGMTLSDLSLVSGVSVSMISKVETGNGDPSLSTLRELARALNVPVSLLFRDEDPSDRSVIRVNHKHTFEIDGVQTTLVVPAKNSKARLHQLFAAPGAHRSRTEYWTTTLLGDGHDYEYGIVISGQMELVIAEETFLLGPGDSISFPSSLPRSWRNPGSTELHAIWCATHLEATADGGG